MHQTQFAATAFDESPNDNISVPYGLIRTVRHYLEFVGLLRYIRGLKTKGIKLDSIVRSLNHLTLTGSREGRGPFRAVLSNWEEVSRDNSTQ